MKILSCCRAAANAVGHRHLPVARRGQAQWEAHIFERDRVVAFHHVRRVRHGHERRRIVVEDVQHHCGWIRDAATTGRLRRNGDGRIVGIQIIVHRHHCHGIRARRFARRDVQGPPYAEGNRASRGRHHQLDCLGRR